MTMIEGRLGAKVQSWKKSNPRDVLKEIVEKNPGASKASLHEELVRKVITDEEMMNSIIEYWFTNNYNSLTDGRFAEPPEKRSHQSAQRVAAISQQVRTKIKTEAAIMLMEMIMPNGVALKHCTGRDCRTLSTTIGHWLEMVADRLKPGQKVGDHLDEAQLKELYSTCASS